MDFLELKREFGEMKENMVKIKESL